MRRESRNERATNERKLTLRTPGFEFSAVFTVIAYLAFRTLEIKIYKR